MSTASDAPIGVPTGNPEEGAVRGDQEVEEGGNQVEGEVEATIGQGDGGEDYVDAQDPDDMN